VVGCTHVLIIGLTSPDGPRLVWYINFSWLQLKAINFIRRDQSIWYWGILHAWCLLAYNIVLRRATRRFVVLLLDTFHLSNWKHHIVFIVSVCLSAGIIVAYYNRPMFPEYCRDSGMDDRSTYDTMVRVAGSYTGVARAFQAVLFEYKWNRVVLLSDQAPGTPCTYSSTAIYGLVSGSIDWRATVHWIQMETAVTVQDLVQYLTTARSFSRGDGIVKYVKFIRRAEQTIATTVIRTQKIWFVVMRIVSRTKWGCYSKANLRWMVGLTHPHCRHLCSTSISCETLSIQINWDGKN